MKPFKCDYDVWENNDQNFKLSSRKLQQIAENSGVDRANSKGVQSLYDDY